MARRTRGGGWVLRLLGVAGELLVTLGVFLGLFVTWQLWWTDVVAARAQTAALEELDWAVDVRAPVQQVPDAGPEVVARPGAAPRRDNAPVIEEPPGGTTFATLRVPRWGPDYVRTVSQGSSPAVLNELGIGHYEGTAMPGALGNFAVSGHRTTYNKPFNRVEELRVGDALVVQTAETWYVYRVSATEIVLPSQVDVIAPVPNSPGTAPTVATMTLTTCHPMYSASQRFIVYSVLDYWMPVADGIPSEIDAR